MAYLTPRLQVIQEFQSQPIFSDNPLAACVVGPRYKTFRYNEVGEKASIFTGLYDPDNNTAYGYIGKNSADVVDQNYIKVFFDDAQAVYLDHLVGNASDGETATVTVARAASATIKNRLRTNNLVFKSGNGHNRSPIFSQRDVQVGDIVVVSSGSTSLTTKVSGFVAETNGAIFDEEAVISASNKPNSSMTVPATASASVGNTGVTDSLPVVGNTYTGKISAGIVVDTYTITCTTAAALAENLRFTITSNSGAFSPKTNVAPSTSGILIIDNSGNNNLTIDLTDSDTAAGDYDVGDTFTLSVNAAVTQTVGEVSGTYTGNQDITYFVTVVRGGPFFNGSNSSVCARVQITSTNVDSSGPVNVPLGDYINVGTKGLLFLFDTAVADGGLILGDRYEIQVQAGTNGAFKTLVLQDNLPPGLDDSVSGDVNLQLRLVASGVEIPAVRSLSPAALNWESSVDEIELKSGVTINSPLIFDGVDQRPLPVKYAKIYVQRRDLVVTGANILGSLFDPAEIQGLLGTVTPDNPIAQAAYHAAINSSGTVVYYMTVASDDLTGYNEALNALRLTDKVYGIVPTTFDTQVQDAVIAHVLAQSNENVSHWRQAWISQEIPQGVDLYVAKPDNTPWTATVIDNPLMSGTQYTLVQAVGAGFIAAGVRAGDILRINYSLDPAGNTIWDEYEIAAVNSETDLLLVSGPDAAITPAVKFQIRRNYTTQEKVNVYAARAASLDQRRVNVVFPDNILVGSAVMPGYFAAAAIAGFASSVVPHQGLTNTEILGIDGVPNALGVFNAAQLDQIAEQGVMILTQDIEGTKPYIRHQLTSANSNLSFREQSVTRNVDNISYALRNELNPIIGKYNVNVNTLDFIKDRVSALLYQRTVEIRSSTAGPQLLDFEILKLEQNQTFKDRVDIEIRLSIPYPLNFVVLKLVV